MKISRNQYQNRPLSLLQVDLPAKHLMLPALLVLSACGGGGGSNNAASAPSVALAPTVDVSEGDTSPLADGVDTQVLQQTAARNAAQGITANLSGAQRLNVSRTALQATASTSSTGLFPDASSIFSNRVGEQLFNDGADLGLGQVDITSLDVLDGLFDESSATQTNQLVEATLGLGENGGAMVQRNGNTITVDPDDAALCEAIQSDQIVSASEVTSCQQLVSNLTVQLDAVTEQRGEITYLYSNQPLLGIAYGPLNAAYTLNLGTLHQMGQYADQLAGITQDEDAAQKVQGSVRLQARVSNSTAGQEAGNVRLEIIEGLLVNYADGGSLSMAPSLLMSLDHNDALGTASVEMALGATELRGSANDPGNMSFAGFTAQLSLNETTGSFDVSDLGFVNGPLRISDSSFSADLTMQAIAFAFEEQTEQLVFNRALNLVLNATSTDPDFGNSSFRFNLNGPAGTRLNTASSSVPANTVLSGGPLQLDYSLSAGGNSETGYITWSTNSCQGSASVPQDESVIMSVLGC